MRREILIYASSHTNADMFYFAGLSIPDAFFAFTNNGKRCAILSPLEIGRARKHSNFANIYELDDEIKIFKHLKLRKFLIPKDFPANIYKKLIDAKFDIKIAEGSLFKEREIKSDFEASQIKRANAISQKAYARIIEILANSSIAKNLDLIYEKQALTSEFIKREIDLICLYDNARAESTIVASGEQACDPHNEGSGKIKANTQIICDIFPRLNDSKYFGDMTRTFLKGVATKEQIAIYNAVKKAQGIAIENLKANCIASSIHKKVCNSFEKDGFNTYNKNGSWRGFFHSTGHGVGLDIHEEPRLSIANNVLKEDSVVTVEPGLYYPKIGACRIEDCVRLKKNGVEMLSNFGYDWQIR
ncbi:MAG: Xaa-Pro peptidase family protein [Opitutales bacterium]